MRSREELIDDMMLFLRHNSSDLAVIAQLAGFQRDAIQIGRELERAEMGQDAARFVWMANNTGCFWGIPGFGPVRDRKTEQKMTDLRAAIDAAMNAENGQ